MHIKLKVNKTLQIESILIYDGNEFIREAEVNDDLIALLNSIEIDLTAYMNLKYLAGKNDNLNKLIKIIGLDLIV